MTTTIDSPPVPSRGIAGATDAILRRRGFVPGADGYRRGALAFHREGEWLLLALDEGNDLDPIRDEHRPGLWKPRRMGGARRLVFPLPASILRGDDGVYSELEGDPEAHCDQPVLEPCLLWAMATLAGEAPEGWEAPGEEELAAWIGPDSLTIQHDAILRQVEIRREGGRFALRVPIAGPVPAELPETRRAWFRTLLTDTQDHWHLPRVRLTDDRQSFAEVDLTGVPASASHSLFMAGLASLRWMAAGLMATTEFVLDPAAPSDLLQTDPPRWRTSAKPSKQQKQNHG